MAEKVDPTTPVASPGPAIMVSAPIGALTLALSGVAAFVALPPTGWSAAADAPVTLTLPVLREVLLSSAAMTPDAGVLGQMAAVPSLFLNMLSQADASVDLLTRAIGCIVVTWTTSRAAYRRVLKATRKTMQAKHARGPEPLEGPLGVAYLAETWRPRNDGQGVELLPGLRMPLHVEAEGIAAIGRPGSGKSAIVDGLGAQALARGDRAFFLDAKCALAHRLRRFHPYVLALRGRNIAIWAVGADIISGLDALEFAAVLIPESREPVWAAGSRLILAAMIRHCQAQFGLTWGWAQLHTMLSLSIPRLEKIVRQRMPEVAKLLESNGEDPSNAVLSLILNLVAHVGAIAETLANAEKRTNRRLSLSAWSKGEGSLAPIVLPLDSRYCDQSAALAQLVVRLLRANLLDPEVPPGVDHRVWILLDELPRVGKTVIEPVQALASLGRDRGIRTVMTCQSPQQLVDLLGEAGSAALRENFGVQIVCRAAAGENAHSIAEKWIGKRTVRWTDYSESKAGKRQTEEIFALPPEAIIGDLGLQYDLWGKPFIRAAVLGYKDIPILEWRLNGWHKLGDDTPPGE